MQTSTRDRMFRRFQIQKFDAKRTAPAVTMLVNVNVSPLLEFRKLLNHRAEITTHITVTHMVIKAVADTLIDYPILYSFFDGKNVVTNPELILNIPVDVENHVEYLILRRPNAKTLDEIARECESHLQAIQDEEGEFFKYLQYLETKPGWIRNLYAKLPGADIRFLREHYGAFAISNFGSFNVAQGAVAISKPMIASLCIGKISPAVTANDKNAFAAIMQMPLSIVFDHRAVDGAYAGKFLSAVKGLLETPEKLTGEPGRK